jgi:hypothetical protein
MTRLEGKLGERPQRPLGVGRSEVGSFGAGAARARAGQIGFVSEPTVYKRPCCKTCKGEACVGRCKF